MMIFVSQLNTIKERATQCITRGGGAISVGQQHKKKLFSQDSIAIVENYFLLWILKKLVKRISTQWTRFLILRTQNSVYMDTIAILAKIYF
jgi:hypothetical protein